MSELDAYIERIRAELGVDPQRADEICAEVRGHLEARAAQLEHGGSSHEDAVTGAMESFGNSSKVAAQLRRANGRFRSFSAFGAIAGFAIVFAAVVGIFGLMDDNPARFDAAGKWITRHGAVLNVQGEVLLVSVLAAPAAVLAGILAGRRYWPVAGLPTLLWGVLVWAMIVLDRLIWRGAGGAGMSSDEVAHANTMGIGNTALLALCAFLGARVGGTRAARPVGWALGAVCLGALGVVVLPDQARDAVARWGALAGVETSLAVLAVAMLWDRRALERRALGIAVGLCVLCAVGVLVAVLHPGLRGRAAVWRLASIAQPTLAAAFALGYVGRGIRVAGRLAFPAVLAGVLAAGLGISAVVGRALASGRESVCMSNMKELLFALRMYAEDHDGRLLSPLPKPQRFTEEEDQYLIASYSEYAWYPHMWHCPSQPRPRSPEQGRHWKADSRVRVVDVVNPYHRTYAYNWLLRLEAGKRYGEFAETDVVVSDTWLMGTEEGAPTQGPHGKTGTPAWTMTYGYVDSSRLNRGYTDGHVESVTLGELRKNW